MSILKKSKIILKMKAKIIFQKNKVDDVIYHFNFNMHEKKIHQKYFKHLTIYYIRKSAYLILIKVYLKLYGTISNVEFLNFLLI